jgi:hypothetical protein
VNDKTWTELLNELIRTASSASLVRLHHWRRTDDPRTLILSRRSGSVVLRNLDVDGVPASALGLSGPSLEVRDTTGQVVAELHTGAAASVLSSMAGREASTASPAVRRLLDQLIVLVKPVSMPGENVARSLINELKSDP